MEAKSDGFKCGDKDFLADNQSEFSPSYRKCSKNHSPV